MPRLNLDLETINAEISRCETLAKENATILAKNLTNDQGLAAYLVRDFTEFSTRAKVLLAFKSHFIKYDGDKKQVAQQVLRELTYPLTAIGNINMDELKAWAGLSMDFQLADF